MSGHSKWAQIKHKKAATDQKRGALFSKMAREITVAARVGSPDPAMNTRLRGAIERARTLGLPKDNVERAIDRAKKPAEEALEDFLYEALGPEGTLILIEGITDSKNRSHAEIKKILTDHNAKLAEPGAVLWNFEKRGEFTVEQSENNGKSEEDIQLALIDAGAQEFSKEEDIWRVQTLPQETEEARKKLERIGIKTREASYGYRAKQETVLSSATQQTIEPLFEKLSDHPDVQDIYTNITSTS
jgi:YebC/PmpR family DNA-binding regulatory protein